MSDDIEIGVGEYERVLALAYEIVMEAIVVDKPARSLTERQLAACLIACNNERRRRR